MRPLSDRFGSTVVFLLNELFVTVHVDVHVDFTLIIIYFIIFYSLLFFIILLGMDPKCLLTSTDLQTRRARCQHQLSFL